jgi:hypothetical protein
MVVGTNTVAEVFDGVDYEIIYAWNPDGGSYHELDDESVVDPHRAYWVKMAAPAQLNLSGEPADDADWFSGLSEGWNMVGIPFSPDPVPFNDFWDGDSGGVLTQQVYYWDAGGRQYERVTADDHMVPGVGYWMACMPVR